MSELKHTMVSSASTCHDQHLAYDAIVVMGKTYAPGQAPDQLRARAALAVLYWQHSGGAAPIICTEGYDLPDKHLSGAAVVAEVAQQAGVPAAHIVAHPLVNCTAREVEAIRDILDAYHKTRPLVITHAYHVGRTRRYLRDVGVAAQVVGCSPALARQQVETPDPALLALITRGQPSLPDRLREAVVERLLTTLHTLDPLGIIERRLADRVRGGGPFATPVSSALSAGKLCPIYLPKSRQR